MMNTADALRRWEPDIGISAFGTAEGLEARLVPLRGYHLELLPKVPLPRHASLELLRIPWRLRTAVQAARRHLDEVDASVVVGFGGYVSFPAYVAAHRRGTPIVVHEANAKAGIANRFGARWAVTVAVAVAGAIPRGQPVGIPLRRQISTLDRKAARAAARQALGLSAGPVLLVTGGSQGARRINSAIVESAAALAAAGVQVLHVAGPKQVDQVLADLGADRPPTHHVLAYVDEMAQAYAACDLVLSRAGAMTCAELAAVGLPAVYVPLPIGNGEQALNAQPTVDVGGGVLVDDAALDAALVQSQVLPLLLDNARLEAMSAAAASLGRRDADDRLAGLVLQAIG
jgi:UDP-N-acetylglucosamine--N-acetylmuramyl-(pentapeptide) pyrophosphoryl-undecaprenol N-acetylglucosamine transferase